MMYASPPQVGVHEGVPASVYHSWDAISNSALGYLQRSPAHLRAYLERDEIDSKELRIGSAAHCLILQPELFKHEFCTYDGTRRGKAWEEFKQAAGKKVVLSKDEQNLVEDMAAAVKFHPDAAEFLADATAREASGIWEDERTGVVCKLRSDLVNDNLATIVDVKTTRDARRDAFERSIFTYGYHRQAAMYLDGWQALGRNYEHFVFICVEKEPPFAVALYRLRDDVVELGRKELRELLNRYQTCIESDDWGAYEAGVHDIGIPAWAINKIENGEES